ncbi:MAG TPA: PHP domain-containing protein [Euzebyales bacterium]
MTHIHTRRSWDSRMHPAQLGERLVELGVDLAVVSDHNSFDGAIEFAGHCRDRGLSITVPVAAEVRTDRGDALVVFEPDSTPPSIDRLLSWEAMVDEVHAAGGLVGLPHPFRSHRGVEELARQVDLIEVFNARCTAEQDARSVALAETVSAARSYGVDAHWARELDRVVVEYERRATVIETLLQDARCHHPTRSPKSDWMAAEVINGIKRRRPLVTGYFVAQYARSRLVESVGRGRP